LKKKEHHKRWETPPSRKWEKARERIPPGERSRRQGGERSNRRKGFKIDQEITKGKEKENSWPEPRWVRDFQKSQYLQNLLMQKGKLKKNSKKGAQKRPKELGQKRVVFGGEKGECDKKEAKIWRESQF